MSFKQFPFSFFIPFALLFTACGDGLEAVEEMDALGYRTEYRMDPETGLKQGPLRQYLPSGQLYTEENYVDDVLDGPRIIYHENGQIDVSENYAMGEFAGEYLTYDSLGNVLLSGQYIAGAMNKAWFSYYPNGVVKRVATFVDNAENGPFREWYENGQPKMSGTFKDGDNIFGTLHRYDSTGHLERILDCSPRCHTFWTPDSTSTPPAGADMTMPKQ